jgi:hypothetical protein
MGGADLPAALFLGMREVWVEISHKGTIRMRNPSASSGVLLVLAVVLALAGCAQPKREMPGTAESLPRPKIRVPKESVAISHLPSRPVETAPPPPSMVPMPELPAPVVPLPEPSITAPPPEPELGAWHVNILATCFDLSDSRRPRTAWNSIDPLKENPFHIALPFNDRVPGFEEYGPCKNRWVEIVNATTGERAFAQWEDVGPWFANDAEYVFDETGTVRPHAELQEGKRLNVFRSTNGTYRRPIRRIKNGAGIDLSPDLCKILNIDGQGLVNWRFVDEDSVPDGPWKLRVSTRP